MPTGVYKRSKKELEHLRRRVKAFIRTEEWNKNISKSLKGHKGWWKGKISHNKGKKYPQCSGKKHWNWKGGKLKIRNRWYIYEPNHPLATKIGYVLQSRLIVEKYLDRYLTKKEIVHHINEIKDDDRLENLYLFETLSKHSQFHGYKSKPTLKSNLI